MTPSEFVESRGIVEVLHYTTERGVYGAIVKNALLSRRRVEGDQDVEFIFQGVWPVKAPVWSDHISLSLGRINLDLFERSRSHHPTLWWGVLSFELEILDHHGVVFTTTNNIYPSCLRGESLEGVKLMFAPNVAGRYDTPHDRVGVPDNHTTDRKAEVLYPGEVPLDHLKAIYVPEQEHCRLVNAWCDALSRPMLPVYVAPEVFT